MVETYLKRKPADEPVYQFLDRKRSEGKLYKVYMTAAANKFLRIYYARVNQVLNAWVLSQISQAVNSLHLAVSFAIPACFQWNVFRSAAEEIFPLELFFQKAFFRAWLSLAGLLYFM